MTPEQLAEVDIAEMNLLCATGLPGAEDLDVDDCLATLDEWAAQVGRETERHLYRLYDPRYGEHYGHSEARLRAEMLAQVLQQDCGVRYNMERIRNIDFTNSKDLLIHGMIDDPNGGTCASMPALYTAVGRRLGYPLKMVLAKGHVFVRWDDGTERFNIETTGNGGTDSYSDEHYKEWPEKVTDADVRRGRYLVSLLPAEELATFLANRGHCLLDNGHAREAFEAYAAAHRLAPRDPAYASWMRQAQSRIPGYRDPLARVEHMAAKQQEAARRRWISGPGMGMPGVPPLYGSQAPQPYVPQPPSPYGPQPGGPQPYQPPAPGPPPEP